MSNFFRAALLFACLSPGAALQAQDLPSGLAGPYLAGRDAYSMFDYVRAAQYLKQAFDRDATNIAVGESALLAEIARGQPQNAVPLALRLRDGGDDNQIVNLVILADLAQKGEFAAAIADLDAGRSAGPLVNDLYRAWSLVGLGRMAEALPVFDKVSQAEGLQSFGLYHKAIALASVGDFEGADKILSGEAAGPMRATRQVVLAHAQVLSQLERNAAAIEMIEKVVAGATDPALEAVRQRLKADQRQLYAGR